jgi:hypothetical protein
MNNLAYFNATCAKINTHVHKNILNKKTDYYEGQNIKCKKYFKLKSVTLQTNYVYKIVKMYEKNFLILNEFENITYTVPISLIKSNFKLPYCLTVDSIIGKSISGDITMFDLDLPYVSRRKLYTMITRAREFKNITIFLNNEKTVEIFTNSRIKQYFRFKINNYIEQDKKANREIDTENYIDCDYILENYKNNNNCKYCGCTFELNIDVDNNVVSNITCDRINNSLGHTKNNCVLSCIICNCSKSNK